MKPCPLRDVVRHASLLAATLALCGPALAQAPQAWSHGVQDIPASYEQCRQRAVSALRSAGFGVDMQSGAWTGGVKGPNRAGILCFGTGPSSSGVGIFITANTGDNGVPGAERVLLQQLMAGGAPPVARGFSGTWNWRSACPEGEWRGQLTISPLGPDGSFSGTFSDIGTFTGRMSGNQFQFTRRGQWFGANQEQHWTATFDGNGTAGGRIVRPTERRQDCGFELTR